MKKFLILLIAVFALCSNCYSQNIFTFTPERNWFCGEDYGELFNYTLIDDNSNNYRLHLYSFLPSVGDDDYIKGKHQDNGYVNNSGTLLLKLSNDSIININYSNNKSKYYDYDISNAGYKYYRLTININKNDFNKIINIGVTKIRIETNISYIDLKTNIFKEIIKGYNNIEKQKYDINNKKSIYDNF